MYSFEYFDAERGKAVLCDYLHSDELRREINEGLNVAQMA
jgi:TnpA family transposase